MNITTGSGKNKFTLSLPCAEIIKQAPVEKQLEAKNLICSMLRIPTKDD